MAKKIEKPLVVDTKRKQAEGAVKKLERDIAIAELDKLSGSDVSKMAKIDQDKLIIIIGQMLGLVDDKGVVK